ncbi:MAG: response regulator transcription factor [Dehalococcoidia bacterium]
MQHVLVVDDEPVIRALVAAGLQMDDVEVTGVADGLTAIAAVEESVPDLVLVDVGLPGMDGREVLRRLRTNPETASIPVLLLTGLEPDEDIGADGIVHKPFSLESLRSSVAACLRK